MKVPGILIFAFFTLPVFCEVIATFPDLNDAETIIVGDNSFCINKDADVFLYDLNTFKLIKKVGRKGEAPGEFIPWLKINFLKEKMMIESRGKLSFYSLKGDLIKEMRLLPKYRRLELVGDRYFVSSGTLVDNVYRNEAKILDSNFNEIKTFYRDEATYHQKKQKTHNASTWEFDSGGGKFFIVGSSDFKIAVFNKNGDNLFTISPKYEKEKQSQAYIDAWFQRTIKRRGMAVYHQVKQRVRFAEFFPAIRDLFVDSGHVYVITWRRKQQKNEFYVFGLEGKLVKKTWLPLNCYDGVALFPYYAKNNYLYQLIENEDTETWELHRSPIL